MDNQLDPNADHSLPGVINSMAVGAATSVATAGVLTGGGRVLKPLAAKAADAAPAAVRDIITKAGKALHPAAGCNSFAAATLVLMADGTSQPIDHIKVGDKIANALPGTDQGAKDQTHTVTAIHITHTDHDYTDLTITTTTGPHTITGTSHHLYWNTTTRAWTPADHLHAGDHLQTTNGHHTTITALHTHTATMVTYNLTIDGLHTYYVQAGTTPVLVHNCPDVTVYHYTNKKGYNGIGSQSPYVIKPGDSKNGAGPFFTNKSPADLTAPNAFKKLGIIGEKSQYIVEATVPRSSLIPLRGDRGQFIFSIPDVAVIPRENSRYFGPTSGWNAQ